jgi:hypothetical protein
MCDASTAENLTMISVYRFLVLSFVSIAITGCETPPEAVPLPSISFANLAPISLDVEHIEIEKKYQQPLKAPNVEHEMPHSLLEAAETWAKDRLRAVGRTGSVRLTIEQASVTETKLKKTDGVKGVFTTDQAERYDGTLSMQLEAFGNINNGAATARATVRLSRTVPEDATLVEREGVWFKMTEAMMTEMNKALEARIRRHMGAYLK